MIFCKGAALGAIACSAHITMLLQCFKPVHLRKVWALGRPGILSGGSSRAGIHLSGMKGAYTYE